MEKKSLLSCFTLDKTPFKHQVYILNEIEKAISEGKKFIVIHAPTGSGKSPIAECIARHSDEPSAKFKNLIMSYKAYSEEHVQDVLDQPAFGCATLTITKSLQDQYEKDFSEAGILKGKRNYQCSVDEDFNVDLAPCLITPSLKRRCQNDDSCPYYKKQNNVFVNKFQVYNYSKFLNIPEHLRHRQFIVCDECSELESELINHFTCEVTYKKLKTCDIEVKPFKKKEPTKPEQNIWLNELFHLVSNKCESLLKEKEDKRFGLSFDVHKYRYLSDLQKKVETVLKTWDSCEYVFEIVETGIKFTPLKIDTLSGELFDYGKHIILMSATIINHRNFCKTLGITDYAYIEVDSSFDAKKSPIFCSKKFPLNHTNLKENLPNVLDMLEAIVEKHEGQKGLIHTHSMFITSEVQKRLNGKRFLYREEGVNNESIIREHSLRSDDTVLISPSLTMGLDLKGDLGLWQVIIKLPYPSLESKRIQKMAELDKDWYYTQMLKVLVQACGRCTRNVSDSSVTYILDGAIENVLYHNSKNLPKYFIDRII